MQTGALTINLYQSHQPKKPGPQSFLQQIQIQKRGKMERPASTSLPPDPVGRHPGGGHGENLYLVLAFR